MRLQGWKVVGMVVGYLVLASLPLVVAYLGPLPEPRPFWTEVGVALGFVGMGILVLQFVLTGRFRNVAASVGLDSMLQFHRQLGLAALLFVLAHPAVLFVTDPGYLAYLDPRANLPRALALSAVTGALLLLVVTTLWRQPMRIPYETWRAIHGALAFFILFIGIVHGLQVGHYLEPLWKQAVWVAAGAGGIALLVNTRLVRPLRLKNRPYRVAEVRQERADATTLVVESEGHDGLSFEPGQFIWLTLGPTPFTIQQHPFSLSSSAERPHRPEITIKALGDFTSRVREVPVGTRAWLEGPFGAFTPRPAPEPGEGTAFIVGGVGITPVLSMLRTYRDRGDERPLVLIYGNPTWEGILFREELDELARALPLTVSHVIERPPEGWEGESGLVTPEILDRRLPKDPDKLWDYFVCGPPPMMDAVEEHLAAQGIPLRQIHSERFNIV